MWNLFKKLLVLFFCIFIIQSCCFAQNNYSNGAILIYNSGVVLYKQGNYELAEEKFNQVLKIQPDFVEAKKNLAIIYKNTARKYYGENDYKNAINYSKKALLYNPKNTEPYYIMLNYYNQINDYSNVIAIYNKLLEQTPDDNQIMNSLGIAYIKNNQPDKAQVVYKKLLLISPNDKIAKQNLEYVNYQQTDQLMTKAINNLTVSEHAPESVYKRIKFGNRNLKPYKERVEFILDLIWSEPNGRYLLAAIAQNRIPIKIINSNSNAQAVNRTETFTSYSMFSQTGTFTTSDITVNIPIKYIDNFYNSGLSFNKRLYNLNVFVHEFGHAFMFINDINNKDSIEEEVGVTMLGYNVASKILTGKYLTREQTKFYSMKTLESILSDEHRKLPVYGGFIGRIQCYGIVLPYPDEYLDIVSMYKELLLEGKVTSVQSFNQYMK
jgi:tetratricopeptide (TPR) repeat protein